jgi:hypothetical protein
MIIKQLSVFLENKEGRLTEVANLLGQANINMSAFSIADTSDFGILRVIVNNPLEAQRILRENNFTVTLTDVVCLLCPNEAGALAKALTILSSENIQIEYMYAFSIGERANVVIKSTNVQKCIDTLLAHKLELLSSSSLYEI